MNAHHTYILFLIAAPIIVVGIWARMRIRKHLAMRRAQEAERDAVTMRALARVAAQTTQM